MRSNDESGFALVMTLLVLSISSVLLVSVISFTSASGRTASYASRGIAVDALAEAGVNNAAAVLSNPSNNALNPSLLPPRTTSYDGGHVTWSGVLDSATGIWRIDALAFAPNPASPGNRLMRSLRAHIAVIPTLSQPLNSPAWNYIYSRGTGATCDMTIGQTVVLGAPLLVNGNLCLENQARITKGPLLVGGRLSLATNNNAVGTSGVPINSAAIGNGCSKQGVLQRPCTGGAAVSVYASSLSSTIPSIPAPTVDWTGWYGAASPGPYFPCTAVSGTPPVFDNDQGVLPPNLARRNNSILTVVDLTPPASYSCRTVSGELTWDAPRRVLTATGTMYIDGSAKIENGAVNSYTGFAAIYLSGTLLIKNSSMCAELTADRSTCTASGWTSNSRMLAFIVGGNGSAGGAQSQTGAGNSVDVVSGYFQGAIYATNAIDIATTSNVDGPLDGSTVKLGQSVNSTWPAFTTVPAGMPGNPVAYAEPQPPRYG
jgi:hypothetical protein